ncbi:hypothetical protein [Nonomuraea roseoviolacea]|uniref:Uncharacterized protein n=1 Tax=Nonomuraea roseoviolacea subsp. carminata TaxID=160689 RepID=A0ABT1JUL6_9ACTN|nr:hypothetical protein [Nonomuraea roseoviolacea]MCP2345132.1 hypothetical protein [Nonomuraea roseoviolacea subsp. carminata]
MDLPLLVLMLALLAALAVVLLFAVLVYGVRADDRRMNLSDDSRSWGVRVTRRVLGMHSRRPDPSGSSPTTRKARR